MIRLERSGTTCVLRLDKPRGNSIDEPLVREILRVMGDLEADPGLHGVLLASGHPKLFCPGLDLVSLVEYDRGALKNFLGEFAAMLWALYGFRKTLVAAISGHAVAGGCVIALTADYRVLRRGAQVGLNEVKVGLPLPWSVALLLRATVAPSSLASVALLGRNFKDDEAVRVGLADEVAAEQGFEEHCQARLQEFTEKDPAALATTKAFLRSDRLAAMKASEAAHADLFLDSWFSAPTRERILSIVSSLGGKG